MELNEKLLEILACPMCKGDLNITEQQDGLICPACKVKYPIREGIPVMLIDEAQPLDD